MKNAISIPSAILLFLGMIIILNCKTGITEEKKSFAGIEACNANSIHKYSVYIPSRNGHCNNMPLVLVLDPQGSGNFAIKHFIPFAEKYKCILVASHLIRNNYSGYVQALEMLIVDATQKFTAGGNMYIAGFSGGARMALTFAQSHSVDGVLACGALGTSDQLSEIKTNVYAFTGIADFNFPEAAIYILNKESKPSTLHLELAGEMHQWPSADDISRGLGSLILNNSDKNNHCIDNKRQLKNLSDRYKITGDSLLKQNLLINASLVYENALNIKDLPLQKYFRQQLALITQNMELKNQLAGLQKSLQFEFKVRDAYFNALKVRDKTWWTIELADIEKQISENKDYMMRNAYRRIKAFLGIVCFSLTNNALRAEDLITAGKILPIYRILEPENPEMFYFSALYEMKTGNETEVKTNLRKALDAGFSNSEIMHNDFPEKYLDKSGAH
ncbi:MAG: hypothetical protein R6W78_09870 [Bacteroidales bacterium]